MKLLCGIDFHCRLVTATGYSMTLLVDRVRQNQPMIAVH